MEDVRTMKELREYATEMIKEPEFLDLMVAFMQTIQPIVERDYILSKEGDGVHCGPEKWIEDTRLILASALRSYADRHNLSDKMRKFPY